MFFSAIAALSVGCGAIPKPAPLPKGAMSPFVGYESARYAKDASWVCRPDLAADPCHGDRTLTELRPDGTSSIVPPAPPAQGDVDCFYVYPTVDTSFMADNHDNFEDRKAIDRVARAQIAQFAEACRVYVPFYRQVTLGTYFGSGPEVRERRLAVAFSDVRDAFQHYMGQYNHGHKIVLIGHSQGAEMIVRLLKADFDHDPTMQARLLVAMPIGGKVEVRAGRSTGGTFDTLPACTYPDQLGCIVAYRSFLADANPTRADDMPRAQDETVCVNPALGAGASPSAHWFSRAVFLAEGPFKEKVHTPYVVLRDFYAGRCITGTGGFRFLGVSIAPAPGDVRKNPINFGSYLMSTPVGLHVLDLQFAQGDLIDLIARKARVARDAAAPSSGAPATPSP
jgi:hypothetical protein